MSLHTAWRATFTRRWHTNADLCHTVDPVSAHHGRVTLLALILFPGRPHLLRAALLHDMGEAVTGDVPSPIKRANPTLAVALAMLEADAIADMGLTVPRLCAEDAERLSLCDGLDAWLWARHHAPHILRGDGWPEMEHRLMQQAWAISQATGAAVEGVIRG